MLAGTLAQLLNRGLARSPRARSLVAALAGRSLAVSSAGFPRLRLSCDGATLTAAFSELPADATLSGGPFTLLRLLGAQSAQGQLQRGGLALEGDTELAARFHELLVLLRPDAEEELSQLLGDVAAHRLANLGRAGRAFAQRLGATGTANLAEYLAHERAHLVPRAEGEQFLRGVDALREDVDRAQARLELIERRREAP